ncbi:MAG TPA: hypothetical protein VHE35_03860, partial [Kofleriaceae bacterium]|nr:hypothetical protein [Kofleriaceae bacterium]
QPSLHPICKQRIVTPIAIDFAPHDGGTLLVTIDPTAWVANVDFATVPPSGVIPDDNSTDASQNLFTGLRSVGAYRLSFQ